MLYWALDDDLSVAILVLYVLSIYFAYSLTRITGGAPTAWYLIIASFVLVLVRRVVGLYVNVQSASIPWDTTEEDLLGVVVSLFLTAGLFMLMKTFRRQVTALQESQAVA